MKRQLERPRVAYHARPVSGLLPLLFALALVEASTAGIRMPWASAPWWALGGVIGGAVLAEVVARWLARRPRAWLDRADVIVQGVVLAAFAWLCLMTGWARWAPSPTCALAPWFALQVAWWFSLPVALRGVWTRWGFVVHNLRFGLMPLALVLPIADLCDTLGRAWGIDVWIDTHLGRGANMTGSFLLMAGILVLLPAVLIRLWKAKPLEDAAVAEDLNAVCRRLGVPVAGILAWPTAGGRVHNAAVIGLLPRLRWVLITEDLLHDAGPEGLRAVLGHELGHARHRHLLVYLLFAAVGGMASWWLTRWAMVGMDHLALTRDLPPDLRHAVVAVLLLAVIWRGLFGVVSRLCERQADLAGVEATGDHRHLCEALLVVARGAGTDPKSPSWRHHSIAERIAFLEAAAVDPALAVAHHRRVRWLVLILALVTAALGFTLLSTTTFGPPGRL